mgnify:CR=1 FL=1
MQYRITSTYFIDIFQILNIKKGVAEKIYIEKISILDFSAYEEGNLPSQGSYPTWKKTICLIRVQFNWQALGKLKLKVLHMLTKI